MKIRLLMPLLAATIAAALLVPMTAAAASDRAPVVINGVPGRLGSEAILYRATAYVSVRDFSMAVGAKSAVRSGNTILVTAPGLTLVATVGENVVAANGRYLYVPDGVLERDGDIYAPVRVLSRAFGVAAWWGAAMRTVYVSTRNAVPIASGETFYSETDVYWLARIIFAEARGEPFAGKVAVGNVIMNRINSPAFPNTVKTVVFDTGGGVQFTPVSNGAIYNTPSAECVIAAKAALDGASPVGDSLYFSSTAKCWAARSRPYNGSVGHHLFYA
jgi:N-acetylmuramoyl-L-alanine amidase